MEFFGYLIGLCSLSIPLTLIGTYHARKMAQIQKGGSTSENEADLQRQINELRQLVAQQAIVLDVVADLHRKLLERNSSEPEIRQRLES